MKVLLKSLCFCIPVGFACNSLDSKIETTHPKKQVESSERDKIFISFKNYDSSNIGFGWFYLDAYNQQIKIVPKANDVSIDWKSGNLLTYNTIPKTAYYPISPGDSVIITKNESETSYPKIEILSKRFSSFELNFPSFLSNKNSSIFEYSLRKIPNKYFPINGNAKQYYERAMLLTDSCIKSGTIGTEYEDWIRSALKYSFYTQVVWSKELADSLISNALIKDTSDIGSPLYRKFLQDYFFNISLSGKNDFKKGYFIAKQKYSGQIRDFLLLTCLLQIAKGSETDKEKYIALFNIDCKNKNFKDYIEQNYTALLKKNSSKNDIVVTTKKRKFSLDSLVSSFRDNVIYIDIWASWCAPCRSEMPNSVKLRQRYAGRNIKFIFLSIDDNYNNWVKANGEETLDVNSYLLLNAKESFFNKKFKIQSIPRYILINKFGKVIDADAPRPGDITLNSLIDKNL